MRTIRNCNVAVVGGAGFLGSHLVDHLIADRNCQVLVIDNLVAGRREFVNGNAEFVHADITGSEEFLRNLFKSRGIQYVFNYAAWPYIPDSFVRPLHIAEVNFMGAIKVINAAQEAGVQAILQVSSAEIYGEGNPSDNAYRKIDETCTVRPHSTYGASKAAVDAAVQVRWKEAKTPVIALRQFNCVGPRETHPYVIPEIISQLQRQNESALSHIRYPTLKLGNNSFRDFQYAGDAVAMATELLERGQFGEVYNMGSEGGWHIYDLAKTISLIMGYSTPIIKEDPARIRPWEIWHLQSDNTKLYSVIERRPQVSLELALQMTIDDFRRNGSKWCWEK